MGCPSNRVAKAGADQSRLFNAPASGLVDVVQVAELATISPALLFAPEAEATLPRSRPLGPSDNLLEDQRPQDQPAHGRYYMVQGRNTTDKENGNRAEDTTIGKEKAVKLSGITALVFAPAKRRKCSHHIVVSHPAKSTN